MTTRTPVVGTRAAAAAAHARQQLAATQRAERATARAEAAQRFFTGTETVQVAAASVAQRSQQQPRTQLEDALGGGGVGDSRTRVDGGLVQLASTRRTSNGPHSVLSGGMLHVGVSTPSVSETTNVTVVATGGGFGSDNNISNDNIINNSGGGGSGFVHAGGLSAADLLSPARRDNTIATHPQPHHTHAHAPPGGQVNPLSEALSASQREMRRLQEEVRVMHLEVAEEQRSVAALEEQISAILSSTRRVRRPPAPTTTTPHTPSTPLNNNNIPSMVLPPQQPHTHHPARAERIRVLQQQLEAELAAAALEDTCGNVGRNGTGLVQATPAPQVVENTGGAGNNPRIASVAEIYTCAWPELLSTDVSAVYEFVQQIRKLQRQYSSTRPVFSSFSIEVADELARKWGVDVGAMAMLSNDVLLAKLQALWQREPLANIMAKLEALAMTGVANGQYESALDRYATAFARVLQCAAPGVVVAASRSKALFIKGLRPKKMELHVSGLAPATWEEAVVFARAWGRDVDAAMSLTGLSSSSILDTIVSYTANGKSSSGSGASRTYTSRKDSHAPSSSLRNMTSKGGGVDSGGASTYDTNANRLPASGEGVRQAFDGKCHNCGKMGHKRTECRAPGGGAHVPRGGGASAPTPPASQRSAAAAGGGSGNNNTNKGKIFQSDKAKNFLHQARNLSLSDGEDDGLEYVRASVTGRNGSIDVPMLMDSAATHCFVMSAEVARLAAKGLAFEFVDVDLSVTMGNAAVVRVKQAIKVYVSVPLEERQRVACTSLFYVLDAAPVAWTLSGKVTLELGLRSIHCPLTKPAAFAIDEPVFLDEAELAEQKEGPRGPIRSMIDDAFPLKEELWAVLLEYQDVFTAAAGGEPSSLPPARVVLKDDAPPLPYIGPRRHAPAVMEFLRKKLDEMILFDIIELSTAPNAAPIVVATNKNGKMRLAIDYKHLNLASVPYNWPLPDLEATVRSMAGGAWFGKADLSQAFYQQVLEESSRRATAFSTPFGIFQYRRLPIGWRNSPAFFQQGISSAFGGLLGVGGPEGSLHIYIDDLGIVADTPEKFIELVRKSLERLREFNLKLNADKVHLGSTSVTFLGHHISREGMEITHERRQALLDLPQPRDVATLRAWIGAMGFVRAHLKNFQRAIAPLTALLKKNAQWRWGAEQQAAYDEVKESLRTSPILAFLDYNAPIYMRTDASKIGVAAILTQIKDGQERVVQYASRAWTDAESKWHSSEQEMYALVFGFAKFRHFVWGQHITVLSDCKLLLTLHSEAPKLQRWRLLLQQHAFTIEHVAGVDNTVADGFSRCFMLMGNQDIASAAPAISFQVQDSTGFFLFSRAERAAALEQAHGAISGHHGVQATLRKLKEMGMSWGRVKEDVTDYIRTCGICQKARTQQPTTTAPIKTTIVHEPLDSLAIDTAGPFPEDAEGYKYVLVMVCMMTRFVVLWPTRTASAEDAAKGILACVGMFGVPRRVVSDKGSQFCASLTDELIKRIGSTPYTTVVERPESNGLAERAVGTMVQHLRAMVQDLREMDHWSSYLPLVNRIMNHTYHHSIGMAPVQLVLPGITPNKGILRPHPELEALSTHEYLRKVMDVQQRLLEAADARQSALVQERLDRCKGTFVSYEPGTLVLVRYKTQPPHKLAPRLKGPVQVISVREGNIYLTAELSGTMKQKEYHVERLIPFDITRDDDPFKYAALDTEEYVVEAILAHRRRPAGGRRKRYEFLVSWKYYGVGSETWEPDTAVKHTQAYQDYVQANRL